MKNLIANYQSLLITFVASIIIIVQHFMAGYQNDFFTFIGLLIMIPSLVFFTIARFQLGNSFEVSAKANQLVTKGIYHKIRHPVYLFGLFYVLGIIIFIQFFYLLIVWLGLIMMQMKRIRKEERVLEEKFGQQYLEYKAQTWF
jgi:protein-S-isoprenylcysteine O-methyltransferase Ste14